MTSLPRSGSQSNAQGGADTSGPQSCYPAEIETLREMLDSNQAVLASLEAGAMDTEASPESVAGAKRLTARRIEALRTAIEALGGAL